MEAIKEPVRLPTADAQAVNGFPLSRRRRFSLPSLRLAASERRVLLAAFDVLVLIAALGLTLTLRYSFALSWTTLTQAPQYFIVLVVLWWAWASFFDCYDLPRTAKATQSAWSTGGAAMLTALTYLAIPYVTPHFPASRLSSSLFVLLSTVSVPAWRMFYATVFVQPTFQQRLLIVGVSPSGAEMARAMASTPQEGNPYAGSGYRLMGFFDPAKAGVRLEGVPVLGHRNNLQEMVRELKIDVVVVALSHPRPELFQALLDCREQGVAIEPATSLYERLTGKVPVEYVGNDLGVVMPQSDSPMRRLFLTGKRLFDLLAAAVGLLMLGLMVPWVALANALRSPGPLFFQQVRVGKGGKPFRLVKFRTMVPDAESARGAVWASENDDRVTPVGRFLRKIRLDELPQSWNILKGEMSLVGPRPERPEFVVDLVKDVPFYQARHAVQPGITGWAQVRYRYGSSVEDALVKLQYDLYYIKRQSLYLELSILVKTAAVMLGLKGR
jgi:exopolysaccharide biosynthesis polyprenyl glycosylphosphotransferase